MSSTHRPAIGRFAAGNSGLPFVFLYDSGRSGPAVTVLALTHGNEIAGASVLAELIDAGVRPRRGRLTLVFANYRAFGESSELPRRFIDRDFNRVWDPALLDGPGSDWELLRARELRPIFEQSDCLLDLHTTATDDPPFLISTAKPEALALVAKLPAPARRIVFERPMHQGLLLIEACGLADPDHRRVGLVAECGQHLAPEAVTVARSVTLDFLRATGVLDEAQVDALRAERANDRSDPARAPTEQCPATAPEQVYTARRMVIARTGEFRFSRSFRSFDELEPDEVFAWDGAEPLRAGFPGAVLLMPRSRPVAGGEAVLIAQSEMLAARVTSPQRLTSRSM